jgi:hypothetical protein
VTRAYQPQHFLLLFPDVEVDRHFFEQPQLLAEALVVRLVRGELLLHVDGPGEGRLLQL